MNFEQNGSCDQKKKLLLVILQSLYNFISTLELEQAEKTDGERFLDMHMYITSALQKSDMRAVTLNLALDLLYEKV